MSRTFVYSDPHFGHSNIIDYESRPFKDVHDMDSQLVVNWNQTVRKDDRVFVLGDISFWGKEQTKEIVSSLQGHKSLILGNHDRGRSVQWWKDVGFDEVSKYPICVNGFFWLSHEPMYLNKHMPYVNIHGHTHNQKYEGEQYFNVCVEHTEYRPILLDSITGLFTTKEEKE